MASNGFSKQPRKYPSIQTLDQNAKYILDGINPLAPMKTLISKVEEHEQASARYLQFNRPDLAITHHIVALDLLLNQVPQNKGFPSLVSEKGDLWNRHRALQNSLSSRQSTMEKVKEQLQAASAASAAAEPQPLSDPVDSHSSPPSNATPGRSGAVKRKPPVQPKPKGLQSRPVNGSTGHAEGNGASEPPADDLKDRFANLKGPGFQERDQPLRMPSPSDFIPQRRRRSSSLEDDGRASQNLGVGGGPRPKGPRAMPGSTEPSGPPHPPKIPLPTPVSMPRPPSPTYSPAYSMIDPIANFERSRTNGSTVSSSASYSQHVYQNTAGSLDPVRRSPPSKDPALLSELLSRGGMLSPEELRRLLGRDFKVLMIDVRERSEFDEGHIYAQSVICVEPLCLREGMSSDELEESLVLSPEREQADFVRRSDFDFVVAYDQDSLSFDGSPKPYKGVQSNAHSKLKILKDALDSYSYEKPLQSPLLLLEGGIDSWVDYIGPQALSSSKTLVYRPDVQSKIRRRLDAGGDVDHLQNGSTSNGATTLRRPTLDRSGTENQLKLARRHAAIVPVDDADDAIHHHNVEDFFRRFPAVADIPQSMTMPPSNNHQQQPRAVVAFSEMPNTARQKDQPPQPHPLAPARPAPTVPPPSFSGVSARSIPTVIQQSRPVFFQPSYKVPQKFIGLYNLGNTCYANSMIQCLNATAPLAGWILHGATQAFQANPGDVSREFVDLIKLMNFGGNPNESLNPKRFINAVKKHHKTFNNDRQQDAQEFLGNLLSDLCDDFRIRIKVNVDDLTKDQERLLDAMPIQLASRLQYLRYQGIDHSSYIDAIFRFQTVTRRKCKKCGNITRTFEHPNQLMLSLAEVIRVIGFEKGCTLKQLLDRWSYEEIDEEPCKVKDCKNTAMARTRQISRAPTCLIIVLTRGWGQPNKNGGYDTYKLHNPVQYPIDNLDLTNHFTEPLPTMNRSFQQLLNQYDPHGAEIMKDPEAATTGPFMYELYAINRHIGETQDSGHYISSIRGEKRSEWWKYSDRTVKPEGPKSLQSLNCLRQTYVLFYRRSNLL